MKPLTHLSDHMAQVIRLLLSQCIPNAEELFSCCHNAFMSLFEQCFPRKEIRIKNRETYKYLPNQEVIDFRGKLDAWALLAKVTKEPVCYDIYPDLKKKYLLLVTEIKKKANVSYIENSNNKTKAVWKVINSELKTKNENGRDDVSLMADDLNKYFCEVGGRIASTITAVQSPTDLVRRHRPEITNSFFLNPTTAEEIENVIRHIKDKHTKDVYGVSTHLLKQIRGEICSPLTALFNKCVEQGVFPRLLKVAKVLPIFKKGEKDSCENYRPISILPTISKVFEQLIASRLISYLESNNLLNQEQHGYRRGKSTTTGALHIINDIYEAFDGGEHAEVNMLDLSKAFDSVSHGILLMKLECYGIRGVSLSLLKSYLSDRTQMTEWNGVRSCPMGAEYGVPQGSILGPLLFIIYMNDLPKNVSGAKLCMYADDTSLLVRGVNQEVMQERSREAIKDAHSWFAANCLKVNLDKTQKLQFSTNNNGQPATVNFLGITVDAGLKWHQHTTSLASRLSSNLYAIGRLKHIASHEAARVAYFANFHSLLSYGILLWGTSMGAQKIFILQKKAIRLLCNLKSTESCRGYFRRENILTLSSIYILAVVTHVHQHKEEFPLNGTCHEYQTRARNEIRIPYHRLNRSQNSIDYWGSKLYNVLPEDVKHIPALASFKRAVKSLLMEGECYGMEEFLLLG